MWTAAGGRTCAAFPFTCRRVQPTFRQYRINPRMGTNIDARRIIAKVGCAALVWTAAAVALALIDTFLNSAWGRIPYLGVLCGAGYLMYRLVREDDPEGLLSYLEVAIYGYLTVFTALLLIRVVLV